jgi:SagB-type dehydrogenase family enzyme
MKEPAMPDLPPPRRDGSMPLEEALARRRSRRDFTGEALSSAELGQLLWAAHGVTGPEARRTAPSAGNTGPLEVYAVTPAGTFHYDGAAHRLAPIDPGDLRAPLSAVTRNDEHLLQAGVIVVLAAVIARTAARYPERAERYVAMGLGHAAQNVLLQAEALGLAAYPVGAHDVERVADLLSLPEGCLPLYLVPVGRPTAS